GAVVAGLGPLLPPPYPALPGDLDRGPLAGCRLLRGPLRRPNVRGHRRLSPLFLPPQLQDGAGLSIPPGDRGDVVGAEGRALVGGAPPRSPPLLRHPVGRPFAGPRRLLALAYPLDPRRQQRPDRPRQDQGLRPLPRAGLAQPPLVRAAGGP